MDQPTRPTTEAIQLKVAVNGEPIRLHLFAQDFVSDIIRRDLYWDLTQTRLLARAIKQTDVVVDVGANLGYYTVLASKLASRGIVHAFEPDPDNFALLRRNCAVNHCTNVVLHNVALSDHKGARTLYRSPYNMGDHRLAAQSPKQAETMIQTEIGDDLLAEVPRVDIIKCDVQGSEVHVFAGLQRLLARSRPLPLMLVEFEPLGLGQMGASAGTLLDYFDALGYQYSFVNWENIFPISRAALNEIARHWLETKSGGNLDLVLSPKLSPALS